MLVPVNELFNLAGRQPHAMQVQHRRLLWKLKLFFRKTRFYSETKVRKNSSNTTKTILVNKTKQWQIINQLFGRARGNLNHIKLENSLGLILSSPKSVANEFVELIVGGDLWNTCVAPNQ